jgi:hypothetical protein
LAGPSPHKDGHGRVWVQLSLWDCEIATYNLAIRLQQVYKDYATIQAICDDIELRWHGVPEIPPLEYLDGEPEWWHDGFEDTDDDEDDQDDPQDEGPGF